MFKVDGYFLVGLDVKGGSSCAMIEVINSSKQKDEVQHGDIINLSNSNLNHCGSLNPFVNGEAG